MKYALNLSEDGRILSVTFEKYAAWTDAVLVDELPEGNVADYLYVNGEYVYDPIPVEPVEEVATADDILNALLGVTE